MGTRKPKSSAAAETFGERLKQLRQQKGLTQAELAARLGISRRNYIYYESQGGSPSPELIAGLADALRVSADVLTGRHTKPDPRLPSYRLLRRLKKLEQLPTHDQKAVLRMIDMMVQARRKVG
jgi:transcriptional regulator with XRE-family HTH domain